LRSRRHNASSGLVVRGSNSESFIPLFKVAQRLLGGKAEPQRAYVARCSHVEKDEAKAEALEFLKNEC
jgi:hypothetical protein